MEKEYFVTTEDEVITFTNKEDALEYFHLLGNDEYKTISVYPENEEDDMVILLGEHDDRMFSSVGEGFVCNQLN